MVPNRLALTELIRKGDDINNWKELVTIMNLEPAEGKPAPESALKGMIETREKECPHVTKWNVIAKNETSILYEWHARPCLGWPDQHEIAKIFFGKYNNFILKFTMKKYDMPDELRQEWIEVLSKARIAYNYPEGAASVYR